MKKFCTVVFAVFSVLLLVISPFLVKKNQDENKSDSIVLTVWHADAFEGGVGSRCAFLRNEASAFSKAHKGVYFLVTNYTIEGLKNALQGGKSPDLVSFGGCDIGVENYAKEIKFNVLDGGTVGKKRYAVSYLKGSYFKITKGDGAREIILPKSEYSSSETALLFSNAYSKNIVRLNSQDAYNRFLIKDDCTLIGTQRDIVKLRNINVQFTATPIDRYNDLFQYFSITSSDSDKIFYANEFIKHVLSDGVQSKIKNISMFSTTEQVLYAGDEVFSACERVKNEYTFIPFSTKDNYELLKNTVFSELKKGSSYDTIVNSCKNLINVVK